MDVGRSFKLWAVIGCDHVRSLTVILFFLMQTKSRTKFRKEILSSKIFINILNNDIKILKNMSSDKIIKSSKINLMQK